MAFNVFGQEILRDVVFPIERTPDNIAINGLISQQLDDGCIVPVNLAGCKIDIYIYEESLEGEVLFLMSSAGLNSYITIYPGDDIDPNFSILVPNEDLIAIFPEDGEFPTRMVITDSLNNPQTYWTGVAKIQ